MFDHIKPQGSKPDIILPITIHEKYLYIFSTENFVKIFPEKIEININKNSTVINFNEIEKINLKYKMISFMLKNGETISYNSPVFDTKTYKFILEVFYDYKKWQMIKNKEISNILKILDDIDEISTLKVEPWVKLVDYLLSKLIKLDVSDIHFEPFQEKVRVTIRKERKIYEIGYISKEIYKCVLARVKYLSGCLTHVNFQPQEGSWTYDSNYGIDIRVTIFPSIHGERLALRFIKPIKFLDLESLAWDQKTINDWRNLLQSKNGLLLIVGPSGSGKTTTLYASLNEIACGKIYNSNLCNAFINKANNGLDESNLFTKRVISIEDPVEAKIPSICQTSLSSYNNISLTEAFKCVLRQDPDVIALGEIRDSNCLKEVLQAAYSGHLILATFHAANIEAAINRIKQMSYDNDLNFSGLIAILAVEWSGNSEENLLYSNYNNTSFCEKRLKQKVTIAKIKHSINKNLLNKELL